MANTRKRTFGTNRYGTPKTGLILPKIPNQKDDDDDTRASFQPKPNVDTSIPSTPSPLVSPLVNVRRSDLHDFTNVNIPPTDQQTRTNDGLLLEGTSIIPSSKNDDMNNDVALDIGSMYDPQIHLPHKPDFNDPSNGYEAATPLGDELMRYIGVSGRGGISVAEYMGRCLRDERFGYYTNPPNVGEDFEDKDDDDYDLEVIDDDSEKSLNQPKAQSQLKTEEENTKKGSAHRIIGAAGDFTTAPEISQIFGECLTIWLLDQYETLGKPARVQLVEIGPGRGTLICDILRSAASIKGVGADFVQALRTGTDDTNTSLVHGVHLVEVSEKLRTSQYEALKALELQMMKGKEPHSKKNESSDLRFDLCKWKTREEEQEELEALVRKVQKQMTNKDQMDPTIFTKIMIDEKVKKRQLQEQGGRVGGDTDKQCSIPVQWYNTFNSIPSSPPVPTFIIGQEILDALPVHVFQKTDEGWKERLVDVAIREDILEDSNKNGNSSNSVQVPMRDGSIATTYSGSISSNTACTKIPMASTKKPRFRYVLSSETTAPLRALLHVDDNGHPNISTNNEDCKNPLDLIPVGTVLEVCPEAMILAQDIASRIKACNGAALLIDYGNEGSGDTLRAFRRHKQVDVLSGPGTVDITADVDFTALKDAVNKGMLKALDRSIDDRFDENKPSSSITGSVVNDEEHSPMVFGPVCQGQFLASMGGVERTLNLIDDDSTTDEQAEDLCNALERLVSEDEMGQRYKVIAIARKKNGIFPPPGF